MGDMDLAHYILIFVLVFVVFYLIGSGRF